MTLLPIPVNQIFMLGDGVCLQKMRELYKQQFVCEIQIVFVYESIIILFITDVCTLQEVNV